MPPKLLQSKDEKKVSEIIAQIADGVHQLRFGSGFNMRAIVILLAEETKISKRTINQVLNGLNELHKHYFEKDM